jgi:hypothetical protein
VLLPIKVHFWLSGDWVSPDAFRIGSYIFAVDPKTWRESWGMKYKEQSGANQYGTDQAFAGVRPRVISFTGTLLTQELTDGDLLDIEDELRLESWGTLVDHNREARTVKVLGCDMAREVMRNKFNIKVVQTN